MPAIDLRPDQLLRPMHLLRPVSKGSVEFLELRDSIRRFGLLKPLLVRPKQTLWEIIDGWTRYTAGCSVGLESFPCNSRELTDAETLIAQLQANACTVQPTRLEYARHIGRLLAADMSLPMLAGELGKSPQWVNETLGLLRLCSEASEQLERGRLRVKAALLLSKLTVDEQQQLLPDALTLAAADFAAIALPLIRRHKEHRERQRERPFRFVAHLRPLDEIARELGMTEVGHEVVQDCTTPLDGFYEGLKWCIHRDDRTLSTLRSQLEAIYDAKAVSLGKLNTPHQ